MESGSQLTDCMGSVDGRLSNMRGESRMMKVSDEPN